MQQNSTLARLFEVYSCAIAVWSGKCGTEHKTNNGNTDVT
jgi:hypothetical protein